MILSGSEGLEVGSRGTIVVDDSGKTSLENVCAGGDAVTGAATVISAMGAGKLAAKTINEYLKNN
jgi:glutamate synthase (NADPH/NADH) small chain